MPATVSVAMLAVLVVACRSGAGKAPGNPAYLMFPLVTLLSVTAGRRRADTGADIVAERDDYLDHLAGLRRQVSEIAAAQRESLLRDHPEPAALWTLVGGSRMWERRRDDPDFGVVRVGTGSVPLVTRLRTASTASHRPDLVADAALRSFLDTHSVIPAVPTVAALLSTPSVTLDGPAGAARALLRAVLCQLAVLHSPEVLCIAAVVGEQTRQHWDWLKWLPHHRYPGEVDGTAAVTVVIVDGAADDGVDRGRAGATVVTIGHRDPSRPDGWRVRVSPAALAVVGPGDQSLGRPVRMHLAEATACARRLAGYRVARSPTDRSVSPHWTDLVGIGDVDRFEPDAAWGSQKSPDRLRVPIGTADDGSVVDLDVKEAAEHGMGPHGLCIGATGSGKSELLRTIVLGMIARHSPAELNLVLVDFKGGATFLEFEQAAHVAAVITNLADEAPLVARMRDALAGELTRRQELLRRAGNVVSVAAYHAARRAGAALPPLPSLLVIVDEFSELLSRHPDFAEVFVAIGRLGRSLGVHLLLASQQLDEGRLRGLESHLSYRICLKTLSANESRMVLGVADAHQLPNTPGVGYLRTAAGELLRFRGAFVSAPPPGGNRSVSPTVHRFTAAPVGATAPAADPPTPGRTVLRAVLDRVAGHGPPAHRVWLPPLGAAPTLAALLADRAGGPDLVVPVGVVDRPFEQRRTPLRVDLRGAAGNVAVIGAPQSGKSTALATLVTALAATTDPARLQVYCLDFGGGALDGLRSLPHVGSVAGRAEPDLVRRTVAETVSIVSRREASFRAAGIAAVEQFRRLRAASDPACGGDRFGDVVLLIDGWAGLLREFGELEESVVALAGRGLSFGVHVVLSASRWAEVRPALRDQIGTRIELRLGDPGDSELDRRAAAQVPRDRPGRGLAGSGLHALIAWPSLADPSTAADPESDLTQAARHAGALLSDRYGGAGAAPVPVLPDVVHRGTLAAGGRPVVGVGERELQSVAVDFDAQPHLLILGETRCGKTATLRTLCAELVRTGTGEQTQLAVIDYRRGLLDAVDPAHLAGYAASPAAAAALLPDLVSRVAQRMPGRDVTAEQLRRRSWWSGPRLYLVVDDYDLVAGAAGPPGNPLTPLLEYLPYADDLGLHLLIARRSGGAARAVYEPLLAALRDLGCMGLMMSGNPDEGPLIGSARPTPLPPGRATLITRTDEQRIQVAWSPPP